VDSTRRGGFDEPGRERAGTQPDTPGFAEAS
jgi:hypothetical protein